MRFIKTLIMVLILLQCAGLIACAKKHSTPLFNEWHDYSNPTKTFNMSDTDWGSSKVTIRTAEDSGCTCTLDIYGNEHDAYARLYACEKWGPALAVTYCGHGEEFGDSYWYSFTRSKNNVLLICNVDKSFCEEYL